MKKKSRTLKQRIWQCRGLYLLILPAVLLLFLFHYVPMYGLLIAFKDFSIAEGVFGSPWVGFDNFRQYFNSYKFWPTIRNTMVISLYSIAVTLPLPIGMALMCNQMFAKRFKKFFQVATYLPHFISTVVMCGIILLFLSPSSGVIAALLGKIGITMPNVMANEGAFPHVYVWTEVWQHLGWDSILYVAALSSVDPTLYEAATMDGASKWQKMRYIDVPMLMPTAVIMLILRFGGVLSVGFEKTFLLQNDLNLGASEVISTYVYKMGMLDRQYGLSTAAGLVQNGVNLILLLIVNQIAKKVSDTSLI